MKEERKQIKNMKEELKEKWKKYLSENTKWCKSIGNHHYFRSRYSSKFWLNEIEDILKREKGVGEVGKAEERVINKIMKLAKKYPGGTYPVGFWEDVLALKKNYARRTKTKETS